VLRLTENPAEFRAMGVRGREYVPEGFNRDRQSAEVVALLEAPVRRLWQRPPSHDKRSLPSTTDRRDRLYGSSPLAPGAENADRANLTVYERQLLEKVSRWPGGSDE